MSEQKWKVGDVVLAGVDKHPTKIIYAEPDEQFVGGYAYGAERLYGYFSERFFSAAPAAAEPRCESVREGWNCARQAGHEGDCESGKWRWNSLKPMALAETVPQSEPLTLAKQRVAIVERMMKLPYIKATRHASVGDERFVARDDMITLIHALSKEAAPSPAETSQASAGERHVQSLLAWAANENRIDYAFHLIGRANSVTILSLEEMRAIVLRALKGEFDAALAGPGDAKEPKR